MTCSIREITNSVVSENRENTERNVRKLLHTTDAERMAANATPLAFITEVIKKTKPTLNGKNVHVLDLKRSKDGVFTLKYKVGTSSTVISADVGDFSEFVTNTSKFKVDNAHLSRLYSDYDVMFNAKDYESLALDITNSPEKIMEVADALIEADLYHNDEAHNRVLLGQLRSIVKPLTELVPNLNVHINNAGRANFGEINVDTNDIYIAKGVGGSKSLLEIYVHELYHAVTHYAISSKNTEVRGYVAKMEKVRNHLLENTKAENLVTVSGGRLTLDQASKLLDHMTNPETGLHEFIAISMTNRAVMNRLKQLDMRPSKKPNQTLFYKVMDAVTAVFNIINSVLTKEPTSNELARMVFLVSKIHYANKSPLKAKHMLGIRNLLSIFEPVERKIADYIAKKERDVKDNIGANVAKPGEGSLRYSSRLLYRAFFDQTARDILGNSVSNFSLLRPEGTIRTALRDMTQNDDAQNAMESMAMASQAIDQRREFTAIQIANTVLNSFSRTLTEEEEVMLTEMVMDTDLSSIYFDYDVANLLKDDKKIDEAIRKVTDRLKGLKDAESVNFYDVGTTLLAGYMVNHTNHIALLKNAESIAKKVSTNREEASVPKEVVVLIDQLASLKALKLTKTKDKIALRALMKEEPLGIDTVVAFQYGQKQNSDEYLFKSVSDKYKKIKGYSAQLMDDGIEVITAPKKDEATLKRQGYKLVKTLSRHSGDSNMVEMAMYVNSRFIMQTYHRIGLRITGKAGRGTSITDSYRASNSTNVSLKAIMDIRGLKKKKEKTVEKIFKGVYDIKADDEDSMLSPVLNNFGAVKDFAYGMGKQEKIDLLGMDRKVSRVLGRTVASIYDKKESETFNDKIMKLIDEDVEKNNKNKRKFSSYNNKEYIKVDGKSDNSIAKEFWKIAPTDIKSKYPEGFFVRRDLMMTALGFRDLSLTDIPGLSGLLENHAETFGKLVKQGIQFAELLWKEIVKISKIDIVIRTPGVFIGNVISNFMLMYVSGYSFREITKLKLQGVKELKAYIEQLKESIELEFKVSANVATAMDIRKLNTLKNNLNNSPVKDLVDEGFYTTILEEMEHGSGSGSYFNRLAKRKLAKAPKIFSDGVDFLYVTENTKLFKLIEKGVQASDFAARYAQYHLMIEQGVGKDKAVVAVRDNFINYNKPNSRFLEWLNQMGFVMFTKYFTRIQRVIVRYGKTDPIKVLLAILAQDMAIGDIDTYDDQWLGTKDYSSILYNPLDHVLRAITPSTLELVDWGVNGAKGG